MTSREEPVFIESEGLKMFSIFHPAENGSTDCGVIFANSGMQNRVGPHRLYIKFARELARQGFNVLRLDFPGIGESEGEAKETHFDAHDPQHTLNAIEYMVKERGVKEVALYGLCAGARNVVKAAAADKRVTGLVSWSVPIIWMPPTYPAPVQDPRGYMSRKGALLTLADRTKKAMTIKGWANFFRKGGGFREIFLYLRSIFWNIIVDESKWTTARNLDFFKSMGVYIRSGRQVLFLYGEKDNVLIEEFKDKFREMSAGVKHRTESIVIPNGNHSFTNIETEKEAIEKTVNWLNQWRGIRNQDSG